MKLRVFVIDDEECIRESLRMYLEDLGHEVFTAPEPLLCDVYCGQDCSEEFPCGDVLLVDYNMPRMTGLEYLEAMAARGCKGAVANKVIMSGDVGAIDLQRVAKLGCRVAAKPLTFADLDRILERALATTDADRELADLAAKYATRSG